MSEREKGWTGWVIYSASRWHRARYADSYTGYVTRCGARIRTRTGVPVATAPELPPNPAAIPSDNACKSCLKLGPFAARPRRPER